MMPKYYALNYNEAKISSLFFLLFLSPLFAAEHGEFVDYSQFGKIVALHKKSEVTVRDAQDILSTSAADVRRMPVLLKSKELAGRPVHNCLTLCGKTGVGKTAIAESIGVLSGWDVYWVGEEAWGPRDRTIEFVKVMKAVESSPKGRLMIFDDIDVLLAYSDKADTNVLPKALSQTFERHKDNPDVFFIATTRAVDRIPEPLKSTLMNRTYKKEGFSNQAESNAFFMKALLANDAVPVSSEEEDDSKSQLDDAKELGEIEVAQETQADVCRVTNPDEIDAEALEKARYILSTAPDSVIRALPRLLNAKPRPCRIPCNCLVLCGSSGTGKTAIARSVALEAQWPLLEINAKDLQKEAVQQNGTMVALLRKKIYSAQCANEKVMVLLDDFDEILSNADKPECDNALSSAVTNMLDRNQNNSRIFSIMTMRRAHLLSERLKSMILDSIFILEGFTNRSEANDCFMRALNSSGCMFSADESAHLLSLFAELPMLYPRSIENTVKDAIRDKFFYDRMGKKYPVVLAYRRMQQMIAWHYPRSDVQVYENEDFLPPIESAENPTDSSWCSIS